LDLAHNVLVERIKMIYSSKVSQSISFDSLAPYEYFRVFRTKGHLTPEERLMLAMLNDAVECLGKYRDSTGRGHRSLYRQAREWVLGTDHDTLYSFENVCSTLSLDPGYLRIGLRHWIDGQPESRRRCKVWREPLRYRNQIGERQIMAD
jgi:hypothetical protein